MQNSEGASLPTNSTDSVDLKVHRSWLGHVAKGANTLYDTFSTFIGEVREQYSDSNGISEKGIVLGAAIFAVGGQVADRFRIPESVTVPYAIQVAENHGTANGALALGAGIYATQLAIGAGWGLGIKQFKKTATVFDEAYPGYKDYVSEENKSYIKNLWRHSVVGLGTGNTPFVAAETLNNPDITNREVIASANKTSRRMALAATAIGYGVLQLAEKHYDRYIVLWSVPDVISRLEKPTTWIAFGVAVELAGHIASYAVERVKDKIAARKIDSGNTTMLCHDHIEPTEEI